MIKNKLPQGSFIWGRNGFDGDVEAGAASRGGRLFKSPKLKY